MNRLLPSLGLLFATLLLAGCGSGGSTGTITGRVTVKGQPLKSGTISFMLKDSPPESVLTFPLAEDGTYKAENVPFGELLVSVVSTGGSSTAMAVSSAKVRMGELDRAGQPIPQALRDAASGATSATPTAATLTLDPKYADPLTSELVCTLDAATKEFNLDLP